MEGRGMVRCRRGLSSSARVLVTSLAHVFVVASLARVFVVASLVHVFVVASLLSRVVGVASLRGRVVVVTWPLCCVREDDERQHCRSSSGSHVNDVAPVALSEKGMEGRDEVTYLVWARGCHRQTKRHVR